MSKSAPCFLVHKIEPADKSVITASANAYVRRGMSEDAAFIRATQDAIDALENQAARIEREVIAAYTAAYPDNVKQILDAKNPITTPEKNEYPFGNIDQEDALFGKRIRVLPSGLKGDEAWEGTIQSTMNGGRLFSVKKDGTDISFRISGDRIEEIQLADENKNAAPEKVEESAPLSDIEKAQADLDAALGDFGDIFGSGSRLNIITPEQQNKLLPVLTRIMDAAFRLGYHKFKNASKFVLDTIRAKFGDEVADQVSLNHLQGAYIGMAGSYSDKGADSTMDVASYKNLDELLVDQKAAIDAAAHEAAASKENDLPAPTNAQAEAGNYKHGHITIHGMDIAIENPEGSERTNLDVDAVMDAGTGLLGAARTALYEAKGMARAGEYGKATERFIAASNAARADGNPDKADAIRDALKGVWISTMPNGVHYGYLKRTTGADGDAVDVFVGPNPEYQRAWIINQRKPLDDAMPNDPQSVFDEHKVMLGFKSGDEAVAAYLLSFEGKFGVKVFQSVSESMSIDELKARIPDLRKSKPVKAGEVPEFLATPPVADKQSEPFKPHIEGDKYITDEPETTYITKKDKILVGVIAKGLTEGQAKSVDKWTWAMKGGFFIRMSHVVRPDLGQDSAEVEQENQAPAEAQKPDILNPDGKFAVAMTIANHFLDGKGFSGIIEARKFISDIIGVRIETATELAKQADETIEVGVVIASRMIVKRGRGANKSDEQIYDDLVKLYEAQPNLAVRSSTSVRDQAYSTPVPLAFIASRLAGVDGNKTVYEPTAGNGALAIEADPRLTVLNELNPSRTEMLKRIMPRAVVRGNNAATWASGQRDTDVVIENPPFGVVKGEDGQSIIYTVGPDFTTREIDHAIVFKSLEAMTDGGRAVLIVGGVDARDDDMRREGYRGKSKREFYFNLYNQYGVVDHFTVDGGMYSKQGAGYPVDVIVIRGRGKSSRALPAANLPKIITSYTALKEKLNDQGNQLVPEGNGAPGITDSGEGVASGKDDGNAVDNSPSGAGGRNGGESARPGTGNAGGNATPAGSVGGRPGASGAVPGIAQPGIENGDALPSGEQRPIPGSGVEKSGGGRSDAGVRPGDVDKSGGVSNKPVEPGLEDRRGQEQETENQVEYIPHSAAPAIGTLVPRAMKDSIQASLSKIEEKVGDIDQFVADSLGFTESQLFSAFSAEQIDALAMAISNADIGKGFIIGDQTGIGKGRVVAGMIRYALKNGKIPIFVTEKPNLYADMIRDLDDIGMTEELGIENGASGILITNSDEKIPFVLTRTKPDKIDIQAENWNGGLEFMSDGSEIWFSIETEDKIEIAQSLEAPKVRGKTPNEILSEMTSNGSIGDYKAIFTTYSQIQTQGGKITERMRFLKHFGAGNFIIFDESHNAGGAGETQARTKSQRANAKAGLSLVTGRAAFSRELVAASGGTMFSSATYAKRPDVMDLYSSTNMMLAVDSPSKLAPAIKDGGVPMQQVVATMLTQDGQYLRRERTFAGVEYATRETPVDMETAENMATAMRRILEFSRAKEAAVKDIKAQLDAAGAAAVAMGGEKASVQGANFGSIMHNLIDQMLLSLKAVDGVAFAIERLNQGEKVVLTVSNTMGSFLADFAEEMDLNKGDPISLSFADLYSRYLEKQRWVRIKHPGQKNGEPYRLSDAELGPALTDMFNQINREISESGFGSAPISPIDYMHNELMKAGFKTDEITGRNIVVNYDGAVPVLGSRSANIKQRLGAISGFNSGKTDLLIINQSGSTGLSLHASSKFKDQRKRRMIIVQAEKNIDTHMQMLGRVHRTGQIMPPAYTQLMAGIPAEMRPAAVLLKKMASLSANTTASRKSSVSAEGVVDFMNDYGGQVAVEYLKDNPDVHRAIGGGKVIAIPDDVEEADESLIRKLTGYIPILPVKIQEEVYAELIERYKELLERENSLGTNKLESKALDLDAQTLSSENLTEDSNVDSVFAKPAIMERIDVKRTVVPFSSAEVAAMAQASLGGRTPSAVSREMIAALRDDAHKFSSARMAKMQADLIDPQRIQNEQILIGMQTDHAVMILENIKIGQPVSITDDILGVVLHGVVTNIMHTGKTKNPAAGSGWKAVFALSNGESKTMTLSFSQIGGRQKVVPEQTVNHINPETMQAEWINPLKVFDMGGTARREKRWMVTGNILAGFSKHRGQIVTYTKDDGTTAMGILMNRAFDYEKVKNSGEVKLKAETALGFIESIRNAAVGTTGAGLRVMLNSNSGKYEISVPASKKDGGKWFLDLALIQKIGADFYKSGNRMMASTYDRDRALDVMKYLEGEDYAIYAKTHIDEARKLIAASGGQNNIVSENAAAYTSVAQENGNEYDSDLFGNPPPSNAGKSAPGRAVNKSGPADNVDAADGLQDGNQYATRTALTAEGKRHLGASKIRKPSEAAQASVYLGVGAVERFDAYVTDKDGNPLAVIGAFKGTISQTSVYPGTIVMEAFAIPGATDIWFSHNHPSGTKDLSSADVMLTATLQRAFNGSSIKAHGIVAMTENGNWSYMNPETSERDSGMAQKKAVKRVDVMERTYTAHGILGEAITNPTIARGIVSSVAGGKPGLVLLDSKNRPIAFLPMKPEESMPLKNNGRLDSLYRALSVSNAASSILFDPKNEFTNAQYQNIGSVMAGVDIRMLDVIYRGAGDLASRADRGESLTSPGGAFFSKGESGTINPHTRESLVTAINQSEGAGFAERLEATGNFKIISSDEVDGILSGDEMFSKGEIDGQVDKDIRYSKDGRILAFVKDGVVYMVADNIGNEDNISGLLKHEIGVHALQLGKSDAELQSILKDFEGMKNDARVKAAFARVPKDTPEHLVVEEGLGYLVEMQPSMPIVQRFLSWFKAQVSNLAGKLKGADRLSFVKWANTLSVDDLLWMANKALKTAPDALGKAKREGVFMSGEEIKEDTVNFWRDYGDHVARRGKEDMAGLAAWLGKAYVYRGPRGTGDGKRGGLRGTGQGNRGVDAAGKIIGGRIGRGLEVIDWGGSIAGFNGYTTVAQKGKTKAGKEAFMFYVIPNDLINGSVPSLGNSKPADLSDKSVVMLTFKERDDGYFELSVNDPEAGSSSFTALDKLGRLKETENTTADGSHKYSKVKLDNPHSTMTSIMTEAVRRLAMNIGRVPDVMFPNRETGSRAGKTEPRFYPGDSVQAHFSKSESADPDIRYSKKTVSDPVWSTEPISKMDTFLYEVTDKHVDTKRVIEAIKKTGNEIADKWNTYIQEALYHGRTAKKTDDFLHDEAEPLIKKMADAKVTQDDLNEYLHARHAIERNQVMKDRNPDRDDNDGLSGMSDEKANEILATVTPALKDIAKDIDDMLVKTRNELVAYGLETQSTVDSWASLYQHYVPLKREGFEDRPGTGMGFAVRGSSTKEATGSHRAVDNILANIAMQREKAIVRGEKNRVALSLYGLAKQFPNSKFWKLDKPAQITQINPDTGMPEVVPGDMADYKVPRIKMLQHETFRWGVTVGGKQFGAFKTKGDALAYVDDNALQGAIVGKLEKPYTESKVVERVDPNYKGRNNVMTVRINGEDRAIIFNEQEPRAMRMVEALKNLDADQLGEILGGIGVVTRYIASVNTQYNPVFGVVNLIRDVQTAALNLSSTELKGKQKEVLSQTFSALKGIYQDARSVRNGKHPSSSWSKLWEEFQSVGGQTGYRQMFATSKDRADAIEHLLDPEWWQKERFGKIITLNGLLAKPEQLLFDKVGKHVFQWLSDYNLAMENSIRLASYKVGIESGVTQEKAAFLAKNLTVNFNKKGRIATQAGALYAFFNASAQGTARIAETLNAGAKDGEYLGKVGKQIVYGGIMLGAMQALALLLAGFDEDEPPEFVRERNLIIPAPGTEKGYIAIPMPLGFHVLPNIGRTLVEGMAYGKPLDRMTDLIMTMLEAFNPIGTGASMAQTISPTVFDPVVALSENKDWTGKAIYREDFSKNNPTPGFTRTKDSASILSKGIAYGINAVTGGTDYQPGRFSPTPDQIDYLIGQATGGVGREATKTMASIGAVASGEDLPTYKIPLLGRVIGTSADNAAIRDKFYDNVRSLNMHEAEIKGRIENGEQYADYMQDNPDSRLFKLASLIETDVRKLQKHKKQYMEAGNRDAVKIFDLQIAAKMKLLNDRVMEAQR